MTTPFPFAARRRTRPAQVTRLCLRRRAVVPDGAKISLTDRTMIGLYYSNATIHRRVLLQTHGAYPVEGPARRLMSFLSVASMALGLLSLISTATPVPASDAATGAWSVGEWEALWTKV